MKSRSLNQSLANRQSIPESSADGQTEMFADLSLSGQTANQAPKVLAFMATQAPTKSAPIPALVEEDPSQTAIDFTAPSVSDGAHRVIPATSATDVAGTTIKPAAATPTAPTPEAPVEMPPIPVLDQKYSEDGQPIPTTSPLQSKSNLRNPIFAYITKSRGRGTGVPTPISWQEPTPIDYETSAQEAVGLATRYQELKDQDKVDRLNFLGGKVALFAPLIRREQKESLIAAVSLAYVVRDSLFAVLCDEHDRQLFKTEREFIKAYLHYHRIGGSESRVCRLLKGAKFWILLVESGLPTPVLLNRLEDLLSLPSDIAVYEYALLSQAAGNQVPMIEAIEYRAAELKGTLKPAATKSGGANSPKLDAIAAEGQRLLEALRDPAHNSETFKSDFAALVATLVEVAAPKKGKVHSNRVVAATPSLACPVVVEVKGLTLNVRFNVPPNDRELVTLVRVRALKKHWVNSDDQTWSLSLPKGPSARTAKIGQVCHCLTQTLATLGYLGPALPPQG